MVKRRKAMRFIETAKGRKKKGMRGIKSIMEKCGVFKGQKEKE